MTTQEIEDWANKVLDKEENEKQIKLAEKYADNCVDPDIAYFAFIVGWNSAQKELKQKIKDSLNNYKSKLKEETCPKLSKEINKNKVRKLETIIKILEKLL
jgi:uncharacterized membrane protein YheB (UPF0754 family)